MSGRDNGARPSGGMHTMTLRKYHVTLLQTSQYVFEVDAYSASEARDLAKHHLDKGWLQLCATATRVGDITVKKTKAK